MEKLSFYESIIKLLSVISSIPFFIEILILTLIMLIIMIFFYYKKTKKGKTIALIIYIVCLLLLPISKINFFIKTFDTFIENFMEVVYFPSYYMYILILLYTDIDVLINFIRNSKKNKSEWYNIFSIIYFCIIQLIFYMIITLITKNNINAFERKELYSNLQIVSIVQVCSYLFWIRILVLIIKRIVNSLYNIIYKKNNNINEENIKVSINNKKIIKEEKVDTKGDEDNHKSEYEGNSEFDDKINKNQKKKNNNIFNNDFIINNDKSKVDENNDENKKNKSENISDDLFLDDTQDEKYFDDFFE